MNKCKVHLCLLFILATVINITEPGSRKRYNKKKTSSTELVSKKRQRRKKSSKEDVNTHMNVDAYTAQIPEIKQPLTLSTPSSAKVQPTAAPQLQTKLHQPVQQYNDPFTSPQIPAAIDKATQPVEMPMSAEDDDEDSIELNFENAELQNFVKQIEDIFEVTFITDDAVTSATAQPAKKTIKNNKISFKTNTPLSKRQAWNLFVTFLDIAGFAVTPQADPKIFRIMMIETARKAPLPTFIGVDYKTLPDTDELIRYVYFLENASLDTIIEIVNPLRSSSSQGFIALREHKGFILTDKAYNIKMLMSIVKELDRVSIPESMSILKLRNADAEAVRDLYKELSPKEDNSSRFFTKKQPTSLFFPENTRIIADPRTNTLILLGPKNAIAKIEHFIVKYIDVELDQAYSPLYTYQLKYAEAETIAEIMNKVTNFGGGAAGEFGGVRGGDQYMRPITFIPEKETNKLIIKGHYDDYIKAERIISQLDAKQPQAAIEVLIASVDLSDTRSFGAQIRSKQPGPNGILGNNIKFQTSGLYGDAPIITNPTATTGAQRLLGNLINLVTGSVPGTSFLSLGADAFGVWGVFQALQTITDTEVVSNPFIIATNNAQATVAIGEERRIITDQVVASSSNTQNAFDADRALLQVSITPQINSDGMIGLAINILINEFALPDNAVTSASGGNATQNTREIITHAIVANKEVLALGGLVRNTITNVETKVPILGDIPLLGWFFKNKRKINVKQSLLILISTSIIDSYKGEEIKTFTHEHIEDYQRTVDYMQSPSVNRDPINRLFFEDVSRNPKSVEGLIFERYAKTQSSTATRHAETTQQESSDTAAEVAKEISFPTESAVANSSLISTVHRKNRTQLSLSQFLDGKEARS
jgi:general secretion pathway protein D